MQTISDMLTAIRAEPTDTVAVHHLPIQYPVSMGITDPTPVVSEIMTASDALAKYADIGDGIAVSSLKPMTGVQADLERGRFADWLEAAIAAARGEDGDGVILGYDPLTPELAIPSSGIEIVDDAVLLRDDAGTKPLFDWSGVSGVDIDHEGLSAIVTLTDGRVLFLHAALDWRSHLS